MEDSLNKIWRETVCLSKPYPFIFFKGCLLQIVPGPLLNTLSHLGPRNEASKVGKTFVKGLGDSAFSSFFKDTGKILEKNLHKVEFDALKIPLKNKDMLIQKDDKGNTVDIFNRQDYICKIKNIQNDRSKFQKVYVDHGTILDHLIYMENNSRCS